MSEQAESVVAEVENSVSSNDVSTETSVEVEATPETVVADSSDAAAAEAVEESESIAEAIDESVPVSAVVDVAVVDVAVVDDTPVAEGASAEVVADDSDAGESDDSDLTDEEGRVVKLLSVGQKVLGKVKRITEFGAFVDIGVGRDGLVHISELSVRRVGKVTDVLQENQEVDVWIKKLDRDRNRISLTLIEPGTKTIRELEKGELVNGTVTRILPYGAFVDIGIGRDALLHIREMSEGYVARPEDVVSVGEELEARIIELSRRRQRVDLSIKGLRPEPEVVAPPESEAVEEAPQAQEEQVVDEFADVEILSPMELAFKRAMQAEGIEIKGGSNKKNKRRRGKHGTSIQEEIIARTLGVSSED